MTEREIVVFEGEDVYRITVPADEFTGAHMLGWWTEGRDDADEWSVIEEGEFAGLYVIILSEECEGDSVKFVSAC